MAGDAARAQAPLEAAIEINPGFAAARADLGWAYLKQGRIADADDQFMEAAEMDPLSAVPRQQLDWRDWLATGREG
jgi:Flp pilus assembly protein TadD